jgi:TolA-binding protein
LIDAWTSQPAHLEPSVPPTTMIAHPAHEPHVDEVVPPPAPTAPEEVIEAATSDEAVTTPEETTDTVVDRTPVDPRERAAYRAAHTLHFEQHDPAGAIAAWDRYLAEYPSGRFALEARYNRALCLVRVGRTTEAREALAPFVAGTHGGYRQHEATALVRALDAQ